MCPAKHQCPGQDRNRSRVNWHCPAVRLRRNSGSCPWLTMVSAAAADDACCNDAHPAMLVDVRRTLRLCTSKNVE